MKEVWKSIRGYEGLYEVSSTGYIRRTKETNRLRTDGILKFGKRRNYLKVTLCINGTNKDFAVHRLVAEAFIPNPNNYPYVNHKDENPTNNNVSNLEWCTAKYNTNYGNAIAKRVKSKIENNKTSIPVDLFSTINNEILHFRNITECANYFNTDRGLIRRYFLKNKLLNNIYKIKIYYEETNTIRNCSMQTHRC